MMQMLILDLECKENLISHLNRFLYFRGAKLLYDETEDVYDEHHEFDVLTGGLVERTVLLYLSV